MEEDFNEIINNEVRKFLSLHEERCLTYTVFNEAHKIYLTSTDEKAFFKFKQIVNDVTNDFKRIALSITQIEKKLNDEFSEKILSSMIRDIQNCEKKKLQLTTQLQIEMKGHKDSPSDETADNISSLNRSLRDTINEINEIIESIKYEIDA